MGLLRRAAKMFGIGQSDEFSQLQAAAGQLREARTELRTSVNGLALEVWGMVETGDPLAALVHGARESQFHRHIEESRE